ncbi:hypothetical protein V8C86DRAFT_2736244, partial [Haematococcus lacustris]
RGAGGRGGGVPWPPPPVPGSRVWLQQQETGTALGPQVQSRVQSRGTRLVPCCCQVGLTGLGPVAVAALLGPLGLLLARGLLPCSSGEQPRELRLASRQLSQRARQLASRGDLGANQLAACLRGATLLTPRLVDDSWLNQAQADLRGSLAVSQLAPDSLEALVTAITQAQRSAADSWRPDPAWLQALEAQLLARLRDCDAHQLAVLAQGLVHLSAAHTVAHTGDQVLVPSAHGGCDADVAASTSNLAARTRATWMAAAQDRCLVLAAQLRAGHEGHSCASDLALMLLAFTEAGCPGFTPHLPAKLQHQRAELLQAVKEAEAEEAAAKEAADARKRALAACALKLVGIGIP